MTSLQNTTLARQFDRAERSYEDREPRQAPAAPDYERMDAEAQDKVLDAVLAAVGIDILRDILDGECDPARQIKSLRGMVRDSIDDEMSRRFFGR